MLRLDHPAIKTDSSEIGSDGEEEQHPCVQVGGDHVAADGQNRIGQEGDRQQDQRGQKMNRVVSRSGNNVFLGQRLHGIRQGLQDAVKSHPVGAVAVLNSAQALAFQNRGQRKQDGEDEQDGNNGQQNRDAGLNRCR